MHDSKIDKYVDTGVSTKMIVKSFTNICEEAEQFALSKGRPERIIGLSKGHGSWSGIHVSINAVRTRLQYPAHRHGGELCIRYKDMLPDTNVTLGEIVGKCFNVLKQIAQEGQENAYGDRMLGREDAQKHSEWLIYEKW
ncbi:hypothetical protein CERZMDRAFT_98738 [Cercospora zeae-maydis SCOH1-5]|uniref:Uncharacterized protein n=1 Tax=Cercospora zeae-maydis SCOH1-5 TaxID=717836 RepID=A0A6A6FC88_9PEZI|nr:hypothetical protein CERZMDRAFT_98738 [Cercospora zeae-maydis SCOH1-5]